MAQNKAAQDLAALAQAQQGAQDQATNLAAQDQERGTQAGRRPYDRDGDGEASYAVPEGIATAVAAGFVLGPVGGAVMGLAQAWLGKQERQNILDQWAAENDTWDNVQNVLDERIADLSDGATNANDIEQLHALRAQQDAAFKLVRSANPNMQQRGMEMMADIDNQVNAYTERQETQRIEQEAIDAQLARELDDQQYTRYQALQDDFQAESQQYEETQSAVNIAKEALERGTPADLHAALILVNKALDPTSVVREEEANAIGNLGNWFTQATTEIQKALGTGQQASVDQRKDLLGVLSTIESNNTQIQLAREARYTTELDLAGLDKRKYQEPFRRVQSVPAYQSRGLQNTESTTEGIGDNASAATEAAGNWLTRAYEADVARVSQGIEATANGLDAAFNAINKQADKAGKAWLDFFVPDSVTEDRPGPRSGRRTN